MSSSAGTSGYLLNLDNGSWVIAFLAGDHMRWLGGQGVPTDEQLVVMHSADVEDVASPLDYDAPYALEVCDIASEVAMSHGGEIETLSVGLDSFSFAFTDGHELEARVVVSRNHRFGLRVYWEQW